MGLAYVVAPLGWRYSQARTVCRRTRPTGRLGTRCSVQRRTDDVPPQTSDDCQPKALNVTPRLMRKTPFRAMRLAFAALWIIQFFRATIRPVLAFSPPRPADAAVTKQVPRSLYLLFFVLFAISAALAAAETAITTLLPWKVRELAEEKGEDSIFVVLASDPTRFLTSILIGVQVTTIAATSIATEAATTMFGPAGLAYTLPFLTLFFLFFGEILPKSLGVHSAEAVLRASLPIINWLAVILYPVGRVLVWFLRFILSLVGLPMDTETKVSEQELRLIVAGAGQSGSIESYESNLINNVLDLENVEVRTVMCPRVDIVALDSQSTLQDFLEAEEQSRFSRMPIYEDSIDGICGVAYSKALLRYLKEPADLNQVRVSEIADDAFFIPESMTAWNALEEMRKRRLHLAIVVDEYGGTAGLVTLEDILEEVVGEIYDEDDDPRQEEALMQLQPDGSYIMQGLADLDRVCEELEIELEEGDRDTYGTISGLLCDRMDGIPEAGDEVLVESVRFAILSADDRRILKLRATKLSPIQDGVSLMEGAPVEKQDLDRGSRNAL